MAFVFNPHEEDSFTSHVDAQPDGWFDTVATTTDASSLTEDVKNVLSLVDQPIFPRNKTAWSAKRALAVHLYQELHRVAGVPHDKQDERQKVANRIANVVNHLGRSCWGRYLEWMKIQNINHRKVTIDPTIEFCLESFPSERVFLPFLQDDGTLARVQVASDEVSSVYKLKITHESRQKEFQVHRLEELRTVSADDDDHQIKLRSLELSEEREVKKLELEDKRSERAEETQIKKLELEAAERAAVRAAEERAAERAAQERAAERAAQERAAERAERAAERDHEFRMLQATPSSNVSSHARTVARPANPSSATPPTAPSTAPPTTTSARNAGSGLGAVQKQLFTGLETLLETEQQAAVAAQPSKARRQSTRASTRSSLVQPRAAGAEDDDMDAQLSTTQPTLSPSFVAEHFDQTHPERIRITSMAQAISRVNEHFCPHEITTKGRRSLGQSWELAHAVSARTKDGDLASKHIVSLFGFCSDKAPKVQYRRKAQRLKKENKFHKHALIRDYTCFCEGAAVRLVCLDYDKPSKNEESKGRKERNLFFLLRNTADKTHHSDGSPLSLETSFASGDCVTDLPVVNINEL